MAALRAARHGGGSGGRGVHRARSPRTRGARHPYARGAHTVRRAGAGHCARARRRPAARGGARGQFPPPRERGRGHVARPHAVPAGARACAGRTPHDRRRVAHAGGERSRGRGRVGHRPGGRRGPVPRPRRGGGGAHPARRRHAGEGAGGACRRQGRGRDAPGRRGARRHAGRPARGRRGGRPVHGRSRPPPRRRRGETRAGRACSRVGACRARLGQGRRAVRRALHGAARPMSARRSILELLLPGGRASRALVLGGGCPERLRPSSPEGAGSYGLVVVAPSRGEAARAWLSDAIERCAGALDRDGAAYVLVPRRYRRRARRLLRSHGLALEPPLLHLPSAADTRQLVPLERHAARDAFERVLRMLFAARAEAMVVALLPDVALVARPRDARPLLAWLRSHGPPGTSSLCAALTSSWTPGAASVVVHPVGDTEATPVVAKLSLEGAASVSREAEALSSLGAAAALAGASVPEPLASFDLDGLPVLVESRVDGRPAAPQLMRRPARLEATLTRVADWLERWQRGTAREAPLSRVLLERELLAPAASVAPDLDDGDGYLRILGAVCDGVAGEPAPLADSHNDLTMWNVLLGTHGRLGVVDWESAEAGTLPLKDFFYMAADAVAATGLYRDRPEAVRDCFVPGRRHAALVAGRRDRIARSLGVTDELAELCFHACWVGHAANEKRAAEPGADRPFLEIVRWLAATLRP